MKKTFNIPNHVAIILDGNGRWAKKRGLPRTLGHFQGMKNLVDIATLANDLDIKYLTVYGFSTENWKRPLDEVNYLMTKPVELVNKNIDKFKKTNIKIEVKGRKTVIPKELLESIDKIENITKHNTGMVLNICFDYGSYDEMIDAFKNAKELTVEGINDALMIKQPVDFLIRTSGEQRLSNFLLWQCAYAEFYFPKVHWPSFSKRHFIKSLKIYNKRNRRFGGLTK